MVIIILDKGRKFKNLRNKISNIILKNFKNDAIKVYDLEKEDVDKCIGCFSCWTKTPGLCTSKNTNEINKNIINAQRLVIISELTYGGFSASSKNIIDKLIPNVSPLFKTVHGEVHHKKRYAVSPSIVSISYKDDISTKEKTNLSNIQKAMCINFHSDNTNQFFIDKNTDDDTLMENILKAMEV